MSEIKIDFTKYTLQELLDCRENIDKEEYPDRAREVDLLIKDRNQQQNQNITQKNQSENNNDDFGFGSGFKRHRRSPIKGFLPNLGFGISQIVLGVIFWVAYGEFENEISGTNEDTWMFVAFASIYSSISGIYHIFKAFKEKNKKLNETETKNKIATNVKSNNSAVRRD